MTRIFLCISPSGDKWTMNSRYNFGERKTILAGCAYPGNAGNYNLRNASRMNIAIDITTVGFPAGTILGFPAGTILGAVMLSVETTLPWASTALREKEDAIFSRCGLHARMTSPKANVARIFIIVIVKRSKHSPLPEVRLNVKSNCQGCFFLVYITTIG